MYSTNQTQGGLHCKTATGKAMHLSQLLVPTSRHGEGMSINNLPMYSKQFGSNVKRYTSFSSVVFLTRQLLNELCLQIWPVVLNCTCRYHGNPGCCLIIFRITSLLTKHKKVIGNLRQLPFIFETQCLVSSTFPGQKNNAEPQIKCKYGTDEMIARLYKSSTAGFNSKNITGMSFLLDC